MNGLTKFFYCVKKYNEVNSIFRISLTRINMLFPSSLKQGQYSKLKPAPTGKELNNLVKDNGKGKAESSATKYTATEVKRYLRGLETGARALPILEEASKFTLYAENKVPNCLRGRERIFEKLSLVLFHYTRGKPTTEIARTVSYLADQEDIEAAMEYVSELIARRVNYRLLAGGSI